MNPKYPDARRRFGRHFLWLGMMAMALQSFGQGARPQRVPPVTQPNRPEELASMRMRVEGQNLTAQIRATPLQRILEELAARSGVVFEIESQENPKVTISFYRVSLQEAIWRLTGSNNSIAYFDLDETGRNVPRFIRIFSQSLRPQAPSLRYIGTGAITKRGDDVIDNPDQALAVLEESTDLVARQKAIEVLVASNNPAAVSALKVALADPAVEVRVAAIEGLASLGARETLRQILPALKDSHPGVRQSAILAVSLLGDTGNLKDIRPLLRDPDGSVAAAAEMAIRKLSARCP
jgi:hypothetical protein